MSEAKTEQVKYIFLDIVGFTKGRSVEAQSDLVAALNLIVRNAINVFSIENDQLILLPTGDGICVAIIADRSNPYDLHLKIALEILKGSKEHNSSATDDARKFSIRIGLNENVDNIVIDINNRQNVAGDGINMAQRIMSQADGDQILVGQSVYDTLRVRESYMKSFRSYTAIAKHGLRFAVHQYIASAEGLNTDIPQAFAPINPPPQKPVLLTKFAAYYIALAIKLQEFFLSKKELTAWEYTATPLLYFLTYDCVGKSEASEFDNFRPHTWGAPEKSLEEQYEYYNKHDFWILQKFTTFVSGTMLGQFYDCFESGLGFYIFINQKGRRKLAEEWPDVLKEVEAIEFQVAPHLGSQLNTGGVA